VRNGSGSGGGIRCVNSWPTILDCAFIDCEGGDYGGGMYINNAVSPSPLIRDCLFADDSAGLYGGGALIDFSEATFENCTFADNSAPFGGAVACGAGAAPTFTNCILAFSAQGAPSYCAATSAPGFSHCCVFGSAGGDSLCGYIGENIYANPMFCDASEGDYHLSEASPCLPGGNAWSELFR
jgi:hypothetical protein